MGTGGAGRVWHLHQVPALVAAGYRVATVDNRCIPPSDECASGMTIDDLVADTAALIEHLSQGPARVVGTSLGARIVQELALARPDLVSQAVMIAAHGRTTPVMGKLSVGERALYDAGIELPSNRLPRTPRRGQHAAREILHLDTTRANFAGSYSARSGGE